MSAIDRNYPDMRALQAQKLSEELAQIRAELDTLPDANTHTPSQREPRRWCACFANGSPIPWASTPRTWRTQR